MIQLAGFAAFTTAASSTSPSSDTDHSSIRRPEPRASKRGVRALARGAALPPLTADATAADCRVKRAIAADLLLDGSAFAVDEKSVEAGLRYSLHQLTHPFNASSFDALDLC